MADNRYTTVLGSSPTCCVAMSNEEGVSLVLYIGEERNVNVSM